MVSVDDDVHAVQLVGGNCWHHPGRKTLRNLCRRSRSPERRGRNTLSKSIDRSTEPVMRSTGIGFTP